MFAVEKLGCYVWLLPRMAHLTQLTMTSVWCPVLTFEVKMFFFFFLVNIILLLYCAICSASLTVMGGKKNYTKLK